MEKKQSAGNDRLDIIMSFFCSCLGQFQTAATTTNNQTKPTTTPNKGKYLQICIVGWHQNIQGLTHTTHSSTVFIIQRMWLVNREKEEQFSRQFKTKYICDWKLQFAKYCLIIRHGSSQYFLFRSASTYPPPTKIPKFKYLSPTKIAWGFALAFISWDKRWQSRCINLCILLLGKAFRKAHMLALLKTQQMDHHELPWFISRIKL